MSYFTATSLALEGSWCVSSQAFSDSRGSFREWFSADLAQELLGSPFTVAQANASTSRSSVIRGIHYSIAQGGQAKWVTCTSGEILDVVVDLRVGSPTFGKWDSVRLSSNSGMSVLIGEGLGHGFSVLSEEAVVVYLLNSPYSPEQEFAVNPLDEQLEIVWQVSAPFLSNRDQTAPRLGQLNSGALPRFAAGPQSKSDK